MAEMESNEQVMNRLYGAVTELKDNDIIDRKQHSAMITGITNVFGKESSRIHIECEEHEYKGTLILPDTKVTENDVKAFENWFNELMSEGAVMKLED